MLYDITQNLDSLRDGFAEMKRLYMSQDIDAMLAYTATMEKSDPTFSSNFITTRNQRMAERLIPLLNKQTVFCAVGAAHLAGEQGVLNYIRKKGFILSPIKFSFMSEGCR